MEYVFIETSNIKYFIREKEKKRHDSQKLPKFDDKIIYTSEKLNEYHVGYIQKDPWSDTL